ncbi:hypothetical protein CIB48_g7451 [Xylaria polymorpha]|nr:hypothetical protein CIB48_g7451 [Xylaria polymorpha]
MSMLYRLSLPIRGSDRYRSQDGTSSDRTKFPTVHIGQSGTHQRTSLSSAFSALFEKPAKEEGGQENVPPRNSKYWRGRKYENTSPVNDFSDAEADDPVYDPGMWVRCFPYPPKDPTPDCERIRSASSSYPSEGIRSPVARVHSPVLPTIRSAPRHAMNSSQNALESSSMATGEGLTTATLKDTIQTTSDTGSEFKNDDALSPQFDPSLMNYERQGAQNLPGTSTRNQPGSGSRTAQSTEWLPKVPNTDRVRYYSSSSLSEDPMLWYIVDEPDEIRLANPATWKYIFAPEPHAPSATIAERIQKMRVRKWMKRVSFKARARFEQVGKRIPESRFIEEREKRRRELELEALGPPPWSNSWRDYPPDTSPDIYF